MATTDTVEGVVTAYADAARAADVDAYVALFDDDVFWGASDRVPVRSVAELRAAIGAMFGRVRIEPGFTVEQVELSGDVAVVVIHDGGTITPAGGDARQMNLTELWVLRQRNDGWKITHLIWNSRGSVTN